MNVIQPDRVVVVDVDDTLVCWDISQFDEVQQVTIEHVNGPVQLVPHQKNINTLIKFWKLGYTMIVWSASGRAWAQAVVTQLGLEQYVHTVMSKPMYYFDDKPAESWIGPRVYRNPHTGKAEE
jgi:predicted phosphatase